MIAARFSTGWFAGLLIASLALADDSASPIVKRIHFDTPVTIDRADYARELPLREGELLSTVSLDESVRWLERKKIFASVRAETTVGADGAEVTFRLEPRPFVVGVAVVGEQAIDEDTLLRRARIREDEVLTDERLEAGRQRLVDLYAERGYPHVEVTPSIETVKAGQVEVVLRVSEGAPLRVERVELTGLDPELETTASQEFSTKAGDIAEKGAAAEGRKSLLRFLRGRGFYEAEVVTSESSTGAAVTLRYEVHLGPRVALAVVGNESVTAGELLGLTDLAERPIVTRGTWQMMALRMKERYAELGYAFAEVRAEVKNEEPRTVRFEVREGPEVRVREVRFRGNRAIDEAELRGAIHVRPRRWCERFGPDPTLFRADLLAEDLDALRRRYREVGYLDAKIEEGPREFTPDKQWVTLTISIVEGPQTVVRDVIIEGAPTETRTTAEDLEIRTGEPFREEAVESDKRLLKKRLGAAGFVDASVTAAQSPATAGEGGEASAIDVHYRIDPGPEVRIGGVVIQNNYFTRDSTVRQSLPFASGDALDLDKLAAAQTEIYRLGLFRSVAVRPIDDAGSVRDVGVEVGERPGGEFLYGFGYDTRAGLRNFLQVSHNNIGGTGDRLSLRGDLNLAPENLAPDEYIVSLDGKDPHFFGSRTAMKANATYQQSQRSIDEFSIRRASFSVGPEREIVHGLRASFFLELEDSDIFDVAPDAVLTGQDVGKLRTVSVNPILLYDGRDDAFKPTRGVFETLRVRYAAPAIGSDAHFLKLILQHSQYYPIGPVTWIYSGRAGYALPVGRTDVIPLRERFFLGGRTSVRGFDENEIGPRGENDDPIGGDILLNVNTEIRFPLFLGLGGAVFADAGGLYLHDRAITIDDFRKSAGPGLRYQTPIGSVSLDYGFKLDRRRGESIGEVHFTIGNIF